MYRGDDITQLAHILRDKITKSATLRIDISDSWELYGGASIKSIDFKTPILTGTGAGDYPLGVDNTYRSYFSLVTSRGKAVLADRHLPMAGGYNFRDLGGMRTKSGKHIKWGRLFRADEMSNLTEADLTYLASIPITSVIDFRAHAESKRTPDRLPSTARFTYPIAITPGNLSSEGIQANLLKTNIETHMKQMNRLLVKDPSCVRAYKILFTIIQNNLSAPLIFHCTAGKDRAGLGAALILFALGVDEETIMRDYMFSKECLEDKYSTFIAKYPRAEPMFTVKRSYLQSALNQIKRDHGNVTNYLTKVLKVDLVKLRNIYLQ